MLLKCTRVCRAPPCHGLVTFPVDSKQVLGILGGKRVHGFLVALGEALFLPSPVQQFSNPESAPPCVSRA